MKKAIIKAAIGAATLAALTSTSMAATCDLPPIQDKSKAALGFELGTQYDTLYNIFNDCQKAQGVSNGLSSYQITRSKEYSNHVYTVGTSLTVNEMQKTFLPAFLKENKNDPNLTLNFNSKGELYEMNVDATGMPDGTAEQLLKTLTKKYGEPDKASYDGHAVFTNPVNQDKITFNYSSIGGIIHIVGLKFESHEYKKQLEVSERDAENALKAKLEQAAIKSKKQNALIEDAF